MFDKTAGYYDAVYSFKDYEAEAAAIRAVIEARRPDARTLLDVACGTGRHLTLLRPHFDEVAGLDIDHDLLEVARSRNPGMVFHEADMTSFRLGRAFDVITCLFSSVGYAGDEAALHRTLACFAAHLGPGGLAIVEPWFSPEQWEQGRVDYLVAEAPPATVLRMSTALREDDRAVLDFHYLVGTPEGVEHFVEHHVLTLFTSAQYGAAFEQAGFAVDHDPDGPAGRGLYVGVKR